MAKTNKRRKPSHECRRMADGRCYGDQGEHFGYPISFNPDDCRFYLHRPGTTDGTEVLCICDSWHDVVHIARALRYLGTAQRRG